MVKVLVLDDAKVIQSLLKMTLESDGMHVDVASTVEEAKSLCNSSEYNLMIVDYMLENGRNGFEFIQSIPENHRNAGLPAILLTADDSNQPKTTAQNLGVNVWMKKPFTPISLLKVIYNLLEQRGNFDGNKVSMHHLHNN